MRGQDRGRRVDPTSRALWTVVKDNEHGTKHGVQSGAMANSSSAHHPGKNLEMETKRRGMQRLAQGGTAFRSPPCRVPAAPFPASTTSANSSLVCPKQDLDNVGRLNVHVGILLFVPSFKEILIDTVDRYTADAFAALCWSSSMLTLDSINQAIREVNVRIGCVIGIEYIPQMRMSKADCTNFTVNRKIQSRQRRDGGREGRSRFSVCCAQDGARGPQTEICRSCFVKRRWCPRAQGGHRRSEGVQAE